jgi:D-alanyl-D-alanine carboxypeptidase
MRLLLFQLVAILACTPALARPKAGEIPDSPQGAVLRAYIQAFNSGETEMRSFFERHLSREDLDRVPVETRLSRFRQMKERLGTLKLVKLVDSNEASIAADFETLDGRCQVTLELAPNTVPTLRGIRVEDLEGDGSGGLPRSPKKNDQELISAVQEHLNQLTGRGEFSGALMIARGDQVLFQKAYGFADREAKIPNRLDTRFNLGSINKVFTNIAIHQLIKSGKLSLSDTIGKILPDYANQEAAKKVTVQHLLSMTSGIGDFFGARYQATDKSRLKTISSYLPLFADLPLRFEPGSRPEYSNGGYIVLGAIIEKLGGIDYFSYVKARIFQPAGMNDSDWYEKDRKVENRATGYTREGIGTDGNLTTNYETLPGKGSSAGGGYSTLDDLFAFVKALRNGIIASPEFHPDKLGVAGGAPGLNAIVETGRGYTIIVLANLDPPSAEKVGQQIRAWLP